jgi:hypothetical protein
MPIDETSDSDSQASKFRLAAANYKPDPMQNVRMNDRVMSAGLGISDTGVASLYNRGWFPRKNAKFTRSNSLYPSILSKPKITVAGFMADSNPGSTRPQTTKNKKPTLTTAS